MTAQMRGANPTVKRLELLELYRATAADLRRCLMLADIAADYGNPRRAAYHLIGFLDELEPELRELRKDSLA